MTETKQYMCSTRTCHVLTNELEPDLSVGVLGTLRVGEMGGLGEEGLDRGICLADMSGVAAVVDMEGTLLICGGRQWTVFVWKLHKEGGGDKNQA